MVLETHVVLCVTEPGFFFFLILPQKWGKWAKNKPKKECFEFIAKFNRYIFLNLVNKESLYYLLYFCINSILRKNLVPEIWAKRLLANQIAGFSHWTYLQNKILKKPEFFACSYKFMKIKSCLENIGVSIVKNGCGYSGFRTLKFGAFQEGWITLLIFGW